MSGWTHLKGEVYKGEVVAVDRFCHRASGLVQRMLSNAAGFFGGGSWQDFTLRDRRCRLRSGRQFEIFLSVPWCRCARASARFFFACGLPAPCSRHPLPSTFGRDARFCFSMPDHLVFLGVMLSLPILSIRPAAFMIHSTLIGGTSP